MGEKEEGPYQHFARPSAPRTQSEKPNSNKHWGLIITVVILLLLILLPVAHYLGNEHYGQQAQEVEKVKKSASSINKSKRQKAGKRGKRKRSVKQRRKTKAKTYVVKNGDTLSGIAAKNGLSVTRLASLNDITDSSDIKIGQTLKLK